MSLLIVEYVSWFAFAGAGLMLAWVGIDVLRVRLRKSRKTAPQETAESGRGLAGPPEPIKSAEPEPEVVSEVHEPAEAEAPIEPAEELVLPSSQAVDVAAEPEESKNSENESEESEPTELEPTEEPEEVVGEDMMLVQRDPSVRVFDAVVAPSERKVLANED